MTGRGRRIRDRRLVLGLALALLLARDPTRADPERPPEHPSDSGNDIPVAESCPLDDKTLDVPIVAISPTELDSVAGAIAERNRIHLARIDSLLQTGSYGQPTTDEARAKADLLARIGSENCYRFLLHWAGDSTHVYEASESTLAGVFERYLDPSLYSIARLQRVRLGRGRICLRYDLAEKASGWTTLGDKRMAWRVKDEKLSGKKRRVLSLDLPSGEGTVEVLLAEHYSCALDHSVSAAPPAPLEVFLVHDVQGGWLRKWGTHRPTAFMFWTTPQDPRLLDLPETPLVGVRIYIPNLRFRLPFFLPDINLDDLRTLELPMPMLALTTVERRQFPVWLAADGTVGLRHWYGHGNVPQVLRERFQDR